MNKFYNENMNKSLAEHKEEDKSAKAMYELAQVSLKNQTNKELDMILGHIMSCALSGSTFCTLRESLIEKHINYLEHLGYKVTNDSYFFDTKQTELITRFTIHWSQP